jgi:hypothetical protein
MPLVEVQLSEIPALQQGQLLRLVLLIRVLLPVPQVLLQALQQVQLTELLSVPD